MTPEQHRDAAQHAFDSDRGADLAIYHATMGVLGGAAMNDELDDDNRCELREGEDRCPNRATQIVSEPYTPAAFEQRVCDDCARSQIDFGYKFVRQIEE